VLAHPQSAADRALVKSAWFTLKVGLVTLVDYTAFQQDADSLTQVGQQKDQ
jgi:hypothetical protein